MNEVHIISNGPSAADAPRLCLPTIAVNWAASDRRVDWRVAMDGRTFARPPDDARPGLFVGAVPQTNSGAYFMHWLALRWLDRNAPETAEALTGYTVMLWPAFHPDLSSSGIAAIMLAGILGARKLHLSGYDMDGVSDCAGLDGVSRTPDRWERERAAIATICERYGMEWEVAR